MNIPPIYESEYKFCEILWENEPITSRELVSICAEKLEWKKSTTFTVIRRLVERGIIKSENTIVTSLVSKGEVQLSESRKLIDKNFGGSLPSFIAAFAKSKKLTDNEIEEIQNIINRHK